MSPGMGSLPQVKQLGNRRVKRVRDKAEEGEREPKVTDWEEERLGTGLRLLPQWGICRMSGQSGRSGNRARGKSRGGLDCAGHLKITSVAVLLGHHGRIPDIDPKKPSFRTA